MKQLDRISIQVGTLAMATRDTGVCRAGELGGCYELYTIGNRPSTSFIFERGGYDGFSPQDLEMFLEVTAVVFKSIASYRFTNVGQLLKDFSAGRFAEAFDTPVGQA